MAEEDAIFLTREYKNLLDDMIRWYRSQPKGRSYHTPTDEEDDTGTYLAHVPDAGIPALVSHATGTGTGTVVNDDVPGYADCEIYKVLHNSDLLNDVTVVPAGFTRTVYNFSILPIPRDSWIVINQDNFGTWLVKDNEVIQGTVSCVTTRTRISNVCVDWNNHVLTIEREVYNICTDEVISTVCETNPSNCCPIQVICCDGTVYLLPRKVCAFVTNATGIYARYLGHHIQFSYFEPANPLYQSGYTSDVSDIPGAGNSFCMQFFCDNLSAGVSWEISRCQGVGFNPLYGFSDINSGRAVLGCPNPADILPATTDPPYGSGADTITFYLTEGTCQNTSGTGTGTSTGGSTSTPCCVAGLPSALYITINEDCLAGTYLMVFNHATSVWLYEGPDGAVCSGGQLSVGLQCFGGNWIVSIGCTHATTIQSWQWSFPPTCTLPFTLGGVTGTTSGGTNPCIAGALVTLSGSIHT